MYYNSEVILEADPNTFIPLPVPIKNWRGETLWSDFSKDAARVYERTLPLEGADLNTFEVLNSRYAKDRNHVYKYGKVISFYDRYGNATSASFDAQSFAVFSATRYVKDKNGVYIEIDQILPNPYRILEADLETFRIINEVYAVDKNHVYSGENILNDVDPHTFELILSEPSALPMRTIPAYPLGSEPDRWATPYTRDKNRVYYRNNVVDSANAGNFKALNYNFGTDGVNIFFEDTVVSNADPATFKILNWQYPAYAKDAQRVYHGYESNGKGQIIEGADPDTFTLIYDTYGIAFYSKDKMHVFWKSRIIPNADPGTFTLVEHPGRGSGDYAKDKNSVFIDGEIVPEADPATFSPP